MVKIKHFLQVPWTGLGNFNGFRGNRWLKNRITVFKQFVIPSLQAQTCKDFTLHCCWRREERNNPLVKELVEYLNGIKEFKTIHTFTGILFWDDKFSDKEAELRLAMSLHGAMQELVNHTDGAETILMTIQPSDDCYSSDAVETIQRFFREFPDFQAMGFTKGYICDYVSGAVSEYNPLTNPPFFTVKFDKDVFLDSQRHMAYAKYKSHEYVGDFLKYAKCEKRGFLVGTHYDNISTHFDNPYAGKRVVGETLKDFGLDGVEKLVIPFSLGRIIFNKLPHQVKRKLRYWSGDKKWILRPLFAMIYNALRS